MLGQLFEIILERKKNPVKGSYTCQLFEKGEDEILKKIGEETVEVILAAKGQGNTRLVEELGDLCYHVLVLLALRELAPQDIQAELEQRQLPQRTS